MDDGLSIEEALAQYDRVPLTRTPTPLDELHQLSEKLGPSIYLKRDDLTDLALGGDKPRKLEYELALARESGTTHLVTCGSAQSNHARLTTAAARKLGLECTVVLSRGTHQQLQGNLLTVYLMGANVQFVDAPDHWDLERHALAVCETLRRKGESPHYIPISGTTPTSCLGYVRAGLELADQIEQAGLRPDAIYAPFGTGGILTSLLFALRERGIGCPVVGISVNRDADTCREHFDRWWDSLCDLLDRDRNKHRESPPIHDEFVGAGYGDATAACLDAICEMAQCEGILLDPVYSGKVAAGMLAHIASGRWTAKHTLLMIHSGGAPALFAYHRELREHLIRRGVTLDEED